MRRLVEYGQVALGVIGFLTLVVAVARKCPIDVSLTGAWRIR